MQGEEGNFPWNGKISSLFSRSFPVPRHKTQLAFIIRSGACLSQQALTADLQQDFTMGQNFLGRRTLLLGLLRTAVHRRGEGSVGGNVGKMQGLHNVLLG